MRVKRYIVDSMPEALEKIRADLGKDAVILNSKPVKTGGLFGMFGKMRIEVIAAVDERAERRAKRARSLPRIELWTQPTHAQAGTYTAKQAYRKAGALQTMPRKVPLPCRSVTPRRTQSERKVCRGEPHGHPKQYLQPLQCLRPLQDLQPLQEMPP